MYQKALLAALAAQPVCFAFQEQLMVNCLPNSFRFPKIAGARLLDIKFNLAYNYSAFSMAPGTSVRGSFTIDFCNVTVTYDHEGWNDPTNVQVWLPLYSWNGKLQALGGGGYVASFEELYLTQAVAKGYVAIGTDAGHESGLLATQKSPEWVLTSPGNLNLYLLEDFASRSLHDMAIIGKAITKDFYGCEPTYSYFSGCSGGGRQALTIAQKYATDFDGILAAAPAIDLQTFIPASYWPYQVMKNLDVYPPGCEIDAFTQAAINHCDELDGVKDGIISKPKLCKFQASSVVGEEFACKGTMRRFTKEAAEIVEAAWNGPKGSPQEGWYGLNKDASLTSLYVGTECSLAGECFAAPNRLRIDWFKYLLAKDPNFVIEEMSDEDFFSYLRLSKKQYRAMMGAADPNLSEFRAAGGKMISWHGLADQIIPPGGSLAYYEEVLRLDPEASSYFRFFEAPGIEHCQGGPGYMPNDAFDQLVAWVENGTVPTTLKAVDNYGYPSQSMS